MQHSEQPTRHDHRAQTRPRDDAHDDARAGRVNRPEGAPTFAPPRDEPHEVWLSLSFGIELG